MPSEARRKLHNVVAEKSEGTSFTGGRINTAALTTTPARALLHTSNRRASCLAVTAQKLDAKVRNARREQYA